MRKQLILRFIAIRRVLLLAATLALCLFFLFPAISEAHALLIRSDPTADATFKNGPPSQVHLWFSEGLNPDLSTARVVNAANQRVDLQDARVSSSDNTEIDLSLKPNLPPAIYVVIWRSHSAADGHVASGSYIFTVAFPNGSLPTGNGLLPGQNVNDAGLNSGQLDGPAFTSLFMVTLVDLGAVFWVGAQLWRTFVLQLMEPEDEQQRTILERTEQRFDRVFSLPTLLILLLANIGVLIGQALSATSGMFAQNFSFSLIFDLATDGRFGTYWTMREIVVLLALLIGVYVLLARRLSSGMRSTISWANLLLGLALLISLALSGHAAAVGDDIVLYSVLVDWLHLLGASLWIGGMMYLATAYLPVLQRIVPIERTRSLLSVLPRYSPLAIVGVLIIVASGPFNAVVHISSFDQLFNSAYGRTLIVKLVFVAAVMLTSAIHVGLFRPRLQKEYQHYQSLLNEREVMKENGSDSPLSLTAEEVKQSERSIREQTTRLSSVLRWEPLLGVGILVCTGLLNIFAATLTPVAPPQTQQPGTGTQNKPFTATVKTTDNLYTITINVSPNRFGTNQFTVTVLDSKGKVDTNVGVSVYTTMLDMDMGTQPYTLQLDGKGHFTASGDLDMGGNWQLRITVRTPDNTQHDATVKMVTPY